MIKPEDIDFAVSDTFAKGLNELHGWGLNMEWEDPEQDWWVKLQQRWAKDDCETSEDSNENEPHSYKSLQREIKALKSENQYILRKLYELANSKHKKRDCF
ncbi:MAG: hypothetical protein HQ553_04530 [Chloroflexi bacterium]|nr:hypothetical protein [Chloroflexota bacterium]